MFIYKYILFFANGPVYFVSRIFFKFSYYPLYVPVFTHAPSVPTINNSFIFPSSFFIIDEYISIDVDLCGEMCPIYLFPDSLNNVMCSYFLFVPFLNLVISFRPSKYKINVG